MALPKVARSFLQGNAPEPLKTTETDVEMLARACGKLLNYDRVNVINDEAHHCYRHKVGSDVEGPLTGDEKKEAAQSSVFPALVPGFAEEDVAVDFWGLAAGR